MGKAAPCRVATVVAAIGVLVGSAPATISGQARDPVSVIVPPFRSMGPNIGRMVADEVATLIDEMPGYRVVHWETVIDASRHTAEWGEERRANPDCLVMQQLGAMEGVELILCGTVEPLRTGGFDAGAMVTSLRTNGGQDRLPDAVIENPNSAAEYVVERFEEWARGVRFPETCDAVCFPSRDPASPPNR